MPKNRQYQWPASRLSDVELMAQLKRLSQLTKVPINALIRKATDRLIADLRDRMDDPKALITAL